MLKPNNIKKVNALIDGMIILILLMVFAFLIYIAGSKVKIKSDNFNGQEMKAEAKHRAMKNLSSPIAE